MLYRITRGLVLTACLAALAPLAARAEAPAEGGKPKIKLNRDADDKAAAAAETQKKADAAKAAEEAQEAEKAEAAKKEEEAKERFAVPEGGVKELLAFLQKTMQFRPRTQEEFVEYRKKGFAAMKEAAEKIKQIATEEDKQLPGYAEVDGLLLYLRGQDIQKATEEQREKFIADLRTYVADTSDPSRYALASVSSVSRVLEQSGDLEAAAALNRELGAKLASSSNEVTAMAGRKMEGTARRLELPGHPIEITGTEVDGSQFDWSKYQGKVVLVDFWATWCGPCIGELPNVKKAYELYHDKGFDVVGISLDSDRKRLEEFLVKEEIPWASIYEGGGWDTPMAVYYGINSIPRAILVDQKGNVVNMNARGPVLDRELTRLLGPAEEPDPDEKTSDNADES